MVSALPICYGILLACCWVCAVCAVCVCVCSMHVCAMCVHDRVYFSCVYFRVCVLYSLICVRVSVCVCECVCVLSAGSVVFGSGLRLCT